MQKYRVILWLIKITGISNWLNARFDITKYPFPERKQRKKTFYHSFDLLHICHHFTLYKFRSYFYHHSPSLSRSLVLHRVSCCYSITSSGSILVFIIEYVLGEWIVRTAQSIGICSQSNTLCDKYKNWMFFLLLLLHWEKKNQLEFLPSESHNWSVDANQFNNSSFDANTHTHSFYIYNDRNKNRIRWFGWRCWFTSFFFSKVFLFLMDME